jgi:serine/threonine-protein kinase
MGDNSSKSENPCLDSAAAEQIVALCAEYTAARQNAAGGVPPPLEPYLDRINSHFREILLLELKKVKESHQAGRSAITSTPGSIIEGPGPAPATITENATIETARGKSGDAHTLDFAPGAAAPFMHIGDAPSDDVGSSLSADGETKAPLINVAGYQVIGELGRGGMGVVYKARQVGLNRWVALKMVLVGGHAGTAALTRFRAEAKAVALLHHPNIVQIYEVGEHENLPYFSLEFVDGGVLSDRVHRQAQPPREAAHLVETLARAMYYAHHLGVIHRDLKPSNVLLTKDGMPKISDFGLAKAQESDSTQTKSGMILGTPSYMAPEQARGDVHSVGPAADIYALGAILYELLTGRPPFEGASVMQTIALVNTTEPMPPSRLQPKISRDIETICLKCLQKDRHQRYPSALDLAEDLRRFLSDEVILARPVPAWERVMRWCKRNPRVAALVGTVALLLITVAVGAVAAAWKISREKENAEKNAQAEKLAREDANRNAQEAKESQALASKQAQLALQTVYDVVTKADEKLKDKPAMGPLRKEVLELAMTNLGQVARNLVSSGKADRTMGAALQRMGTFYEQMGRSDDAIGAYKNALSIFEQLIERHPEEDRNRANAAVCYDNLGDMGREVEADPDVLFTYYRKALHLRQALAAKREAADLPRKERHQLLSISCVKLGTLALWVGDPPLALAYGRKALEQSQLAAAADPTDAHSARLFNSGAHLILGRACAHHALKDEGRRNLDQCRNLRLEMVQAEPLSALARQELGRALEACGDLEMELGRGRAARERYQQAQKVFEELAEKDSNNPEIQWYLANVRYSLGTAQKLLGDTNAEQSFRSCLRTREWLLKDDPRNPQRKIELMLVLARLGQHVLASKLAQELEAHAPRHPGVLFAVACGYCECQAVADQPLQNHYLDRAAGALTQSIAHGYGDVFSLETNPDLGPFRQYPNFKSVLTQATNTAAVNAMRQDRMIEK